MTERDTAGGGTPQPAQKKHRTALRVLAVLLAVLFAALAGTGGYLIWYYTLDPAVRTLEWVKGMVREHYYWAIDEETLEGATLDRLFGWNGEEALLDQYSDYYTAEELQARENSQAGSQSGIGISFLLSPDGVQVYRVAGNSPAEESGLAAGMYLLAYGMSAAETEPFELNGFDAFLSKRADGEEFVLLADDEPSGEGEVYTVRKAAYRQNYVFYADSEYAYRFTGERADQLTRAATNFDFLPDDVAYIRLDSFTGDAAEQFEGMLEVFEERGRTGLVLDLRNNGGGRVDILTEIAAFLCKDAAGSFPVLTVEYKDGKEEIYRAPKSAYSDYFTDQTEIAVLANCNTASASEALAGAMLDYGTIGYEDVYLAEIGSVARTYGKGIMQTTYTNILTGEGVKLTTAVIRWPVSGNCIHGRGILPADGAVALPCDGYLDGGNAMFRAAVAAHFG